MLKKRILLFIKAFYKYSYVIPHKKGYFFCGFCKIRGESLTNQPGKRKRNVLDYHPSRQNYWSIHIWMKINVVFNTSFKIKYILYSLQIKHFRIFYDFYIFFWIIKCNFFLNMRKTQLNFHRVCYTSLNNRPRTDEEFRYIHNRIFIHWEVSNTYFRQRFGLEIK